MMSFNTVESRFTSPSSFCPWPEYWHSPDENSTEDEVSQLVAAFVRALQPEFVLETGTAYGFTTYRIGIALLVNGHGKVVSVDSDAKMVELAKAYISHQLPSGQFPGEVLHQNSMEYTPPQDIDFAFFDSWQEGRALEFRRFYDMGFIKPGTIVAFHDTAPHHQVWKSVSKLQEEGLIRGITLHTPRGITFAEVLK